MKFVTAILTIFLVILIADLVYGRPGYDDRRIQLDKEETVADSHAPQTSVEYVSDTKAEKPEEVPPSPIKSRHKRLSDQRRAELETLVALAKIGTGKLASSYRASRQSEPRETGRHKRYIVGKSIPNLQIVLRHKGVLIKEGGAAYPLIS